MPRWTLVIAGAVGVGAVVGHLLFAPLPGRSSSGSESAVPSSSSRLTVGEGPAGTAAPGRPDGPTALPCASDPDADPDCIIEDGSTSASEHEDEDEPWPEIPEDAPPGWAPPLEPTGPEDVSAIRTAEAVAVAFARPPAEKLASWWQGVQPFMSGQGTFDYQDVDPELVPYSAVTGPGQLVAQVDHLPVATVDVPTDAGPYRVKLEPDERKPTGWAVTSIRPVEAYR